MPNWIISATEAKTSNVVTMKNISAERIQYHCKSCLLERRLSVCKIASGLLSDNSLFGRNFSFIVFFLFYLPHLQQRFYTGNGYLRQAVASCIGITCGSTGFPWAAGEQCGSLVMLCAQLRLNTTEGASFLDTCSLLSLTRAMQIFSEETLFLFLQSINTGNYVCMFSWVQSLLDCKHFF